MWLADLQEGLKPSSTGEINVADGFHPSFGHLNGSCFD